MYGKRNTYSVLVGTSYWKGKLKWVVKKRGMRVWNEVTMVRTGSVRQLFIG